MRKYIFRGHREDSYPEAMQHILTYLGHHSHLCGVGFAWKLDLYPADGVFMLYPNWSPLRRPATAGHPLINTFSLLRHDKLTSRRIERKTATKSFEADPGRRSYIHDSISIFKQAWACPDMYMTSRRANGAGLVRKRTAQQGLHRRACRLQGAIGLLVVMYWIFKFGSVITSVQFGRVEFLNRDYFVKKNLPDNHSLALRNNINFLSTHVYIHQCYKLQPYHSCQYNFKLRSISAKLYSFNMPHI